jgi:rod shape-determining protein MreC
MRDRAVRRRRAVLAALVALSLILLTAYFGESAGGGLHAVQRGAQGVLNPVQEGASRALKPVRDLFGWFGETLDAKSELADLKSERDQLLRENVELRVANREYGQLQRFYEAETAAGLRDYEPLTARVITRSASVWYSRLTINKGSSDGIQPDQAVVDGTALVGKVQSVTGGSAVVMLLTDEEFGVAAKGADSGEPGTISPAVGSPGNLLFDLVPRGRLVQEDEKIVTAGTSSSERLPSLFPPGLLIGTVRRVDIGDGELDRRIHVRPAADLRRLDFVQVLTKTGSDLRASATATP